MMDKQTAAELAMIMYVGERCRYCGHEYVSLKDLRARAVVWAHHPSDPPITDKGQSIACKACWEGKARS